MITTMLLAVALLGAQDPAPTPTKPPALTCRLTLSADMSLQDRWFHCPGEMGVNLPEAKTIVRSQKVTAYVFFTHWIARESGAVDVGYDLRIKKPNGGLHHVEEQLGGHAGPVGKGENILLCDQIQTIMFGPEDELGDYVITANVRDNVGRTTATMSKTIKLVDYAEGAGFDDVKSFDRWMRGYYMAPDPARVLPALRDIGRVGYWKDNQPPSMGAAFFHEVLAGNAWLYPLLIAKYEVLEADTKRVALWLLAQSGADTKEFVGQLVGPDKELWEKLAGQDRRDPLLDPITKPAHVDELWGIFYASAKFAAIQKLADALAPERTEAIPDGPERPALKTAAAKSLHARTRDLALVRGYCDWILTNDMTPDGVRDALKKEVGG